MTRHGCEGTDRRNARFAPSGDHAGAVSVSNDGAIHVSVVAAGVYSPMNAWSPRTLEKAMVSFTDLHHVCVCVCMA